MTFLRAAGAGSGGCSPSSQMGGKAGCKYWLPLDSMGAPPHTVDACPGPTEMAVVTTLHGAEAQVGPGLLGSNPSSAVCAKANFPEPQFSHP